MKPPCEIFSKYVLPATRAMIAKRLIEKHGYTQVNAASKLGMTQSAMSRYLAMERGGKVDLGDVRTATDRIAEDIANNKLADEGIVRRLCDICISLRRSGEICKIHREYSSSIRKSCDICLKI